MELFPACLTSPPAKCLHKLLCHTLRSGGLVYWYVISCWSVGLISMVYLLVISIVIEVQQPFFCIPYKCSGSLCKCCDGSGMSVGLQILLLLLGRSLAVVFLSGLSHVLLAILVCFVQCPGLVVVGFQLGSRPASLRLVRHGAMLFTWEQSATEYVCCKFSDDWKFSTFLHVASLRKLNSFLMLVLKSSM